MRKCSVNVVSLTRIFLSHKETRLQTVARWTEGAYMPKSLNYIKPSISLCVVWVNLAYEKMKKHKSMFKRKAVELYMAGEDTEMAALMDQHYAGKFKSSYNSAPWAKN